MVADRDHTLRKKILFLLAHAPTTLGKEQKCLMMDRYVLSLISCFSVSLPFFSLLFYFKRLKKEIYPIVYFIPLITLIDFTNGIILTLYGSYPAYVFSNIAGLVEPLCVMWVYKVLGLFTNNRSYFALLCGVIAIWLTESICFGIINHANFYSAGIFGFTGVLLTVGLINKLCRTEKRNATFSRFAIYAAFMFFHIGVVIPVVFLFEFVTASLIFKQRMLDMINLSFIISYLAFAYAIVMLAKECASSDIEVSSTIKQPY